MLTCEDHIIYPYYQKKSMLAYFSISSLVNQGSFYFRVKTIFLTLFNFGCRMPKPMGRNLGVYKPMTGENLLVLHSRAFAMRKVLLLTM